MLVFIKKNVDDTKKKNYQQLQSVLCLKWGRATIFALPVENSSSLPQPAKLQVL